MTITEIPTTGPDDRGHTAEYFHDRMGRHLIVFRKAGTVSGRHYHKGISKAKNPEIFILLSGTTRVNWRNVNNNAMHSATVTGPARFEIMPFEWHEYITETDCTFLELNSIEEHRADTFT